MIREPNLEVLSYFLSMNTIKKSYLHYARDVTSKRVASGGAYFRSLAPGQHSSEETSQLWRVF